MMMILKPLNKPRPLFFEYIEIWYNKKRLLSYLGRKTPYEVELEFYQFKNMA